MAIRDLLLRVRALVRPRQVEQELDEELAFHLECETRKLVAHGVTPEAARQQAVARFGSRTVVADACRDARGVAGVESLWRDVVYALRSFRRAPLAALTIVATLTLGLAVTTTAFSVFNAVFMRVDDVYRPSDLYAVRRVINSRASAPFTLGEYDAFRRDTAVFSDTTVVLGGVDVRVDGRLTRGRLVRGNFFQVLGVLPAHGRVLTPSDDQPGAVTSLVLSDRGWTKLFARNPGAIGRRLRVNGTDAEIVGIMADGFFGLAAVPPDFWGPLGAIEKFKPADAGNESHIAVDVVGRLKPGVSPVAALDSLKAWAAGPGVKLAGGRPVSIDLRPSTGVAPEAAEALPVLVPIFVAFGLVLLIGCANVANLLLARGIARQQEIGIRLSLGASRRRIARQLLSESLLLALAAAAGAYPAARMFMSALLYVTARLAPPEAAEQLNAVIPSLDWHVLAFLLVSAVIATCLFGVVPALHATRLDPAKAMRGELTHVRPSRMRQALVAAQVAASALLLIATAVFLRGALAATRQESGLRIDDTVVVSIGDELRRTAVLRSLAGDPLVSMIAAASPPDWANATSARAPSTGITASLNCRFTSPDYFPVMGIDIVRGRGFVASERGSDAGVVLVSEEVATRLWPDRDAIGQAMRFAVAEDQGRPEGRPLPGPGPGPGERPASRELALRTFTVVGIVRSFRPPVGLNSAWHPHLFLPADLETPGTQLTVRVRDDPYRARARIIERLTPVDPALGAVTTLRTMFGVLAYVMGALFLLGVALGALALLLTVSGLFSVLSYIVEQRAKEIGVRMALGASARSVVRLVLVESGTPVSIGLTAGAVLAAGVAGALMATPVAAEIGYMVRVFDPVAYMSSLLVIVISCALAASVPALRAASVDPMTVLRKE